MTPDNANAVMESHLDSWGFELPATYKVLAAVKEDTRDYKPDPKSRTAWELATHLAVGDGWFLPSILDGKCASDPAVAAQAEAQFATVADGVSG